MTFEIHSQSTIHDALKVTFSILTAAFGLLRTVSMFFLVTCSWEAILSNMLQHYPRLSNKVRLCLSDPQMVFVGTSRIFPEAGCWIGWWGVNLNVSWRRCAAGGDWKWSDHMVFAWFMSCQVMTIRVFPVCWWRTFDWWNIRVSFLQVQVVYHTHASGELLVEEIGKHRKFGSQLAIDTRVRWDWGPFQSHCYCMYAIVVMFTLWQWDQNG